MDSCWVGTSGPLVRERLMQLPDTRAACPYLEGSPLVPKLHLGTHIFSQLGWAGRWLSWLASRATQLPGQARSQVQLGNEGNRAESKRTQSRRSLLPDAEGGENFAEDVVAFYFAHDFADGVQS